MFSYLERMNLGAQLPVLLIGGGGKTGSRVNAQLDGRNAQVMHGVEEALGRPAHDFAGYARRAAATGRWRA